MKCLQLIETGGPGGAEKMLLSLVAELENQGIETSVVLIKSGWLSDQCRSNAIKYEIFSLEQLGFYRWFLSLLSYIRKNNFDVIHSHEFFMNCVCSLIGALLRVKTIGTVHGKNYYGDRARRRIMCRVAARLGLFVAVSADIRNYLISIGIREKDVRLIQNGIDCGRFSDVLRDRAASRKKLQIEESRLVVVCVGNLYPVKGHKYLLDALPDIVKETPEVLVLIAGRGECEDSLISQARRLGVSRNFRLLGFVDNISELLACADIFVQPSVSEGLPLSILEAMSAGLPVIATNVGGVQEVISSNTVGRLVAPANSSDLIAAVLDLANDPAERERVGLAAKGLANERFSSAIMAAGYLAEYSSL